MLSIVPSASNDMKTGLIGRNKSVQFFGLPWTMSVQIIKDQACRQNIFGVAGVHILRHPYKQYDVDTNGITNPYLISLYKFEKSTIRTANSEML